MAAPVPCTGARYSEGDTILQELIEEAIIRKAQSVLRNRRIDRAISFKNADRYRKRTGLVPGIPSEADPAWWNYHPHFDPAYCIRHARYLSRTIWRKLQDNLYHPVPAIQFDLPKPDGSHRKIMAFAIPDSALANLVHRKATKRNINLFSRLSYAYRPDQNVFDAILNLSKSLDSPKSYIVQYDFSKYFDTIDHSYIRKVLFERQLFLLPEAERNAINSFLKHEYAHISTYSHNVFDVRDSGVPQGSSLSLFLSNAAAHELDLALEKLNGTFVRFADDVVAVAHSYSDALAISAAFRDHCNLAGLKINYDKSPGILLFGGSPEREMRTFTIDTDDGDQLETISKIDYLGHSITACGVNIPSKSIKRIKSKISSIVHKNLFLHRRNLGDSFNPLRVGPGFTDWDLTTCINEIRKYIYGGLRESQIDGFLSDASKPPYMRGLMGFFPLITDPKTLIELDGWLLNIIARAQRERRRMLSSNFGVSIPVLTKKELISGSWYQYPEIRNDASLPSFVRAWRAARKYYRRYGLSGIEPPRYYSLNEY
ncbi:MULTISPECIES: reverse transcriptase domain-containing protein [unclassified Sphingomonas]|uniref:reverse transcriptase domain-containing protein n=1 Tax=unclassified Sphingomonas TaxID=196159 RepID=UPI0012E210E0|nr:MULTISPECIES: reverse transcriptase domain-containing protein [unclassified Sphingomonas]